MYITVKPNAPCKDCEERHHKCHSNCEKYKAFLIKKDAEYKKMTKAYEAECKVLDYEIKRVRKIQKKGHRRNG